MIKTYYNDNDPYVVQWLRNLIEAGLIAPGDVDGRGIQEVLASDLNGYRQCHFFAGIGVWSHALRLAGWDDDRAIWTGSCPCQPFSSAGSGLGTADKRHLWPEFFRLIRECRPGTIVGEQVAGPAALAWFDLVSSDLEDEGYAVGASDLCAASVGAPHIRQRLYWMAHTRLSERSRREHSSCRGEGQPCNESASHDITCRVADGGESVPQRLVNSDCRAETTIRRVPEGAFSDATGGFWAAADWLPCRDGKERPVEPKYVALFDGYSGRLGTASTDGKIAQEVVDGDEGKGGPSEILYDLQPAASPQAVQQRSRIESGLSSSQVLRQGVYGCGADAREFADFVRLLPSSFALAKLSGDSATTQAMLALLKASGAEELVLHPSYEVEAVWRSLAQETKDLVRLGFEQGRFVRSFEHPLAHGITGRVGRLRAYGNSLVAPCAAAFVRAVMDCLP